MCIGFLLREIAWESTVPKEFLIGTTEDPVKSLWTIAHLVRLQGFALEGYRLQAPHSWQGNKQFRV
jgi:hypothetical protein